MQKTCKKCLANFEITDKDLEFYKKVSPKFGWKTYEIPAPTLCPDCRQQRRLSFRNERNLYKRKCDATGENIISIYSPDKKLKVYNSDFWWSDKWDALDYGQDFDFNRPFFEQFKELMEKVPVINLSIYNSENCEYNNLISNSKNCYMCFDNEKLENTMYSSYSINSKNSLDLLWSNAEKSYEILDSDNIYNSFYISFSDNIVDSYFCFNCSNCKNCFWCVNLNNKSYYIFNKKYSKETYFKEINKLLSLWINNLKNKYKKFLKTFPKRNLLSYWNINCLW